MIGKRIGKRIGKERREERVWCSCTDHPGHVAVSVFYGSYDNII
jgi:hypothetical protein